MDCPHCSKQVTEDFPFCPYCGGKMPEKAEEVKEVAPKPPRQQTLLDKGWFRVLAMILAGLLVIGGLIYTRMYP